ncbi:serine hydrolase domain-containing protein [Microlunatus sp. GCM10028923]|uniref:serine hydrolase domain-containing protein n=1 Tax=Microlunatus sp. GCM10028923 TaxID=3273400 RepID=UPI0036224F77
MTDDAARDQAVIENGLRPPMVVAGQPVPTRSLDAESARLGVPGVAVAVIEDGRVAWTKGYGRTGPDGTMITERTPFQAGSISKAVAALGVVIAAPALGLSLDEDVAPIARGWLPPADPAGRPVTLRGLLSHTAGTTVRGFRGHAAGTPVPTLRQVIDGATPADTPPVRIEPAHVGDWHYSGGGYAVVQQLLEDAAGRPFDALLRELIFEPLGMADSTFRQQPPAGAAQPHAADGVPVAGGPYRYPAAAAAGLWSTAADLGRFVVAVLRAEAGGSGPLDPAPVRELLAEVRPGRALGFDRGGAARPYVRKSGDTEGFVGLITGYLGPGDGAVVLTNGGRGRELIEGLVGSIASHRGWPDFGPRIRPSVELDDAQQARLLGSYRYGSDASFTVARGPRTLMIMSPGEEPEPLPAAAADRLFLPSQNADFVFELGTDGAPAGTGRIEVSGQELPFRRVSGAAPPRPAR